MNPWRNSKTKKVQIGHGVASSDAVYGAKISVAYNV